MDTEKRHGGELNIAVNKKARFEYEILDTFEAGVALLGPEVKSLREGRVNMGDAFALVKGGEIFIYSLHISAYKYNNVQKVSPLRIRKLLLHKSEIKKIYSKVVERGLTLAPLRIYFKRGKVKIELGIVRGRKLHDKREVLQEKTMKREAEQAIKNYNAGN